MAAGLPGQLYRSRTDKMLGGVSAGLAAYFDIDPVIVRLLWVVGAVFTGGLLALAYVLLWIIVPQQDYTGAPSDVVRDNMNELAAEARRVADDVREALRSEPAAASTSPTGDSEVPPSSTSRTGYASEVPLEATSPIGDSGEVTPSSTSPIGEAAEVSATTSAPIGAEAAGPPSRSGRELLSPAEAAEARRRRTITAGAILLGLGVLFLASNLGLFRWFNWGLYWPLLLVALGALLIWNRTRSGA